VTQQGEFQRIAEISRRLAVSSGDVLIGIGDDAAVLSPSPGRQVLSVDAQVEGVHFSRDLLQAHDVGYRALVAALSDLAAMGARPRAALVAFILPTEMPESELYSIVDGIAEAQREYGCPVVGGNLAAGPSLSITTTVIGSAAGAVSMRSGCRVGDGLFVCGELGSAAVGLAALQARRPELAPHCVAHWRRPIARIADGLALRAVVSSMIDLSDGLLQDAQHVCEASGVGFDIEFEQLPLHSELRLAASALGLDPNTLAVAGGEDYALLFTAPSGLTPAFGRRIGTATAGPGLRLLDATGQAMPLPSRAGFDHFRSPA
jgi:thiamine-monophosphate kinase